MRVTLLVRRELERLVPLDREGLAAVAEGLAALSAGAARQPPIMHLELPDGVGEVDVKAAFLPGLPQLAVKLSSGFFANPARGLPSASGLMVLLSAETGVPEALLLDGGYLTDLRTALAGALAADHLALRSPRAVGVLGAGAQAAWQLRALTLVRPVPRAYVWARRPAAAHRLARELEAELGLPVEAATDRAALVAACDVIVTTTPARETLLEASWLHEGLHVTAMGSDAPGKRELDPEALARADRLVVDDRAQCLRQGELAHAVAAGLVAPEDAVPLGDVVRGAAAGRRSDASVTVCDLTGTGAQDTAIAVLALRRARAAGVGTTVAAVA